MLAESADWDRAFTALQLRYEGDVRVSAIARILNTEVDGVPVVVRLRREEPHWISVSAPLSDFPSDSASLHRHGYPGSFPMRTSDSALSDRISVKGLPNSDLVERACRDGVRDPLFEVLMSSSGSRVGPDEIEMYVEFDSSKAANAIATVMTLHHAWVADTPSS